jgi:hypothetical protein
MNCNSERNIRQKSRQMVLSLAIPVLLLTGTVLQAGEARPMPAPPGPYISSQPWLLPKAEPCLQDRYQPQSPSQGDCRTSSTMPRANPSMGGTYPNPSEQAGQDR